MGGGQTQTQNSTEVSNRTPWAPAIPGLQTALTDAQSLYNSGVGGQVYQGQRVADFNNDTNMGINRTRDTALTDDAGSLGTNYLQGVLGSNGGVTYNGPQLDANGLSAGTAGALGQLQAVRGADLGRLNGFIDSTYGAQSPINQTAGDFMSGGRDIQTGGLYNALFGAAAQPTSSGTNLADVAAGKFLDPTANPLFAKLAQTSADNALNAQKQAFAASGRYGSGSFAGATTKAINDTQSALFANQYNTERAAQAGAAGQIDSANQAQIGLGNTIANSLTNLGSLNNQQRLSGAGLLQAQNAQNLDALNSQLQGQEFNSGLDLSKAQSALGAMQQGTQDAMSNEKNRTGVALQSQGQGLQAASMLPALSQLRYQGGQALQGIGSAQQQQYQTGLDAAQGYFDETQSKPWELLSQFSAFPTSIGQLGGTTVTQGTRRTQTSGPGLGQSILGGISSGLGLLGQLGVLSDERAKENIRPVGELKDGQVVYSYNYKGSPQTEIGLIAQEVAKTKPEAVVPMGIGDLLGVDYAAATDKAAQMAKKDGGGSSGAPAAPAAPGLMQAALGSLPQKGGHRAPAKPANRKAA